MKLINFILTSSLVLILTSCLGKSSNTMTQEFTPYCMTYIVDNNGGSDIFATGATYRVLNNLDEGTLTLEIGNLKMPNNTYLSFRVADQRYTFNESGAMVVRVPSYTATSAGKTYTITDFNLEYYSRYLGSQAFPILILSYQIDYQYTARVVYSPAYYWGTTTVTDQDGKIYVNDSQTSFYGIQFFPETRKATVGAFGAKFAEGMPAMNMTFKDIPVTLDAYSYTAKIDELIPNIGETPYPSYKITDFIMSGSWTGNQMVSFTCTIDTEKLKGTYKVVASLSVIPNTTSAGN